jgi:Ca2+-binding RTX toxin-like protein
LTGASATVFDNMPFGAGAVAAVLSRDYQLGLSDVSALLSGGSPAGGYSALPTSANITQFYTAGEPLAGVRSISPAVAAAFFTLGLPIPLNLAASAFGNDDLLGGFGEETLSGGAGDDKITLLADHANDFVLGGAGDDTLTYEAPTAGHGVEDMRWNCRPRSMCDAFRCPRQGNRGRREHAPNSAGQDA